MGLDKVFLQVMGEALSLHVTVMSEVKGIHKV